MFNRVVNSLTMYEDLVNSSKNLYPAARIEAYRRGFYKLAAQIRNEYINDGRSELISWELNNYKKISYYFYLLLSEIDPDTPSVKEDELIKCIGEDLVCTSKGRETMKMLNNAMSDKLRRSLNKEEGFFYRKSDDQENVSNNKEEVANLQRQKTILEQEIRDLQVRKQTLEQDLQRDKESAKIKLDEEIRAERNRRYEELDIQIAQEQAERKSRVLDDALAEIESAKQKRIDQINSEAAYQLRREEDDRYLVKVREDIERREQFEDRLCQDMRQISAGFRGDTESIVNQLLGQMQQLANGMKEYANQAVDALERSSANAINEVVDTERRLRKDDYEDLLDNYAQLQEAMFYNVPEEELGLKPTRIEKYLKRFLRVLNRLGYEEYFPAIGEGYDEEKQEAVEKDDEELPFDFTGYGVDGVISYGFSKNGEVCRKARVTVSKNFLGNSEDAQE